MESYKKYQSIAGSGISIANENIIKGKGIVRDIFVSVDSDCGISFNEGDFIKIKGGRGFNFDESCSSVVLDTSGIDYNFGGEVLRCLLSEGGKDGKSAYELAVDSGFDGTKDEWLESLKGADGVIGSDGESAYEIAVSNGFVGDEAQWLDSLNGEAGKDGKNGANGVTPTITIAKVSAGLTPSVTNTGTGTNVTLDIVLPSGIGSSSVSGTIANTIGEIFWWPSATPPIGTMFCDGSAVNRTTYRDLFNIISTQYGSGDGSTTFNLPDLRGEFIRGYDPTNVRDLQGNTRGFGKHQSDVFQNHTHPFVMDAGTLFHGSDVARGSNTTYKAFLWGNGSSLNGSVQTNLCGAISIGSAGGTPRTSTETRPTNINLLPCIRYKAIAVKDGDSAYAVAVANGFVGTVQQWLDSMKANQTAYSLAETSVGLWVDGKTIYQKTLDIGTLSENETKTIGHEISNLGYVVNYFGLPKNVEADITASDVTITASNLASNTRVYLTMQYTRTDR